MAELIVKGIGLALRFFTPVMMTAVILAIRGKEGERWHRIHNWSLIPINVGYYLMFLRSLTAILLPHYPHLSVLDQAYLPTLIGLFHFVGVATGLYMVLRELGMTGLGRDGR